MEARAKILVVDDDPDILEAVSTVLESQSYEVVTAHDGQEGLVKLEKERPDLMILDLLMPKMDGFAVIKVVRDPKRAGCSSLPILMLTAVREDASRRRYELETGGELSVDDYVEKPISPNILLQRVENLLGRKRKA